MGAFLSRAVVPRLMKFINTKAMIALKDGVMYTMPMIIVGALFLLIGNFPLPAVTDWLETTGLSDVCSQISGSSFGVVALIAAVGIAYTYVKNEGFPGLPAGVIALCALLVLQPSVSGSGSTAILGEWAGGKGMIGGIVAGLAVGWVYSACMRRDLAIALPGNVPMGTAGAFSSLLPGLIVLTGAGALYAASKALFGIAPIELIYRYLSMPLQGLTDSFGGVVAMGIMIPFFWIFGIHGSTIIGDGVMGPMLLANAAENQAILDAGRALTVANGGHIVTKQFLDQAMVISGSGVTIGLVVFMLFFAKSRRLRDLGKLAAVPSIFNVNEPIIFGVPLVLNPIMAAPFIVTPMICGVIEYAAIAMGLCPLYGGVIVPWTTPPIISGFLIGGWRCALMQVICLLVSVAVYFPFARMLDRQYLKAEQETAQDIEESS